MKAVEVAPGSSRRLAGLLACGLLLVGCGEEEAADAGKAQPQPQPAAAPAPQVAAASAAGPALDAFVAIINSARDESLGVTDAARLAEILAARHAATCGLLESAGHDFVWPAKVTQVAKTASSGVGLQVEIAHWLFLTTDLNDPAAGAATTLVGKDTPLAATLAALSPGQLVTLRGRLVEGTEGCMKPYGRLEPLMQINPTTLHVAVEAIETP